MNRNREFRNGLLAAAACLLAMGPVGTAHANALDAWGVATGGTVITATSGFLGGGFVCGTAMFGASACLKTTNMLFADNVGAGAVHFIEWQTTTGAVTIESFNLIAVHDGHAFAPTGNACNALSLTGRENGVTLVGSTNL